MVVRGRTLGLRVTFAFGGRADEDRRLWFSSFRDSRHVGELNAPRRGGDRGAGDRNRRMETPDISEQRHMRR